MSTCQNDRSNGAGTFQWLAGGTALGFRSCLLAVALLSLPAVAAADYVSTILADNPIGYWRMADVGGGPTYLQDRVLGDWSANFARCNPPDVVLGGAAGAIVGDADPAATFSGGQGLGTTVRFIDFPGLADFGVNDAYTLEAWVKTTSASYQAIISKRTDNGYVGYTLGLSGGRVNMSFTGDGNANADSFTYKFGGPALNDGAWHPVAVTHVAGTGAESLSLYADGSLLTDTTQYTQTVGSFGDTYVPASPLRFGVRSLEGFEFSGAIDEVAIYNTSLSAGQILAHRRAAVPQPASMVLAAGGAICVLMRKRRVV